MIFSNRTFRKAHRIITVLLLMACQGSLAVAINPNGTGQVLLYPYYTVTDNQDTLISITNTRDESKVLKVTFRESLNSERVFSFHLFLAPNDYWSAAITRHDNGAALLTTDNSCTMPIDIAATASSQQGRLSPFEFKNETGDLKNNGPERTLSGHIEVLEMGVLSETIGRLIKGPNRRCNLLTNEYQQQNISRRMEAPRGGLSGYGVIINPKQGSAVNYNAEAIVQFTDEETFDFPASDLPDLSSGNSKQAYLPHSKGAKILDFEKSIDAVSAVLTKRSIQQEYVLEDSLNARSYWVVSMPTKYRHVNSYTSHLPFNTKWDAIHTEACLANPGEIQTPHDPIRMERYTRDGEPGHYHLLCRESGYTGLGIPKSCTLEGFELCYSANLMDLAYSNNFTGLNLDISAGEVDLPVSLNLETNIELKNGIIVYNFDDFKLESKSGESVIGLPVIGFAAQIYVNGNLNGTIANYAVSTKITGKRVFGDKD